jgi:hypothetical protein
MGNHNIEWYYPESGQGVDKSINDIVSHQPGVDRAVKLKANSIASTAWVQLLWHHRTGGAHVEVARHPRARSRTPDWYVYLRDADPGGEGKAGKNRYDRSAMSIEFGWVSKKGKKVEGLHVLRNAMEIAARKYRG